MRLCVGKAELRLGWRSLIDYAKQDGDERPYYLTSDGRVVRRLKDVKGPDYLVLSWERMRKLTPRELHSLYWRHTKPW